MGDNLKERIIDHLSPEVILRVVVSMGIDPKRAGREHKCLCPAHIDNNPSCTINLRKNRAGIFHCFSCGFSEDLFGFVMQVQGIEFRPALDYIAGQLGLGERVGIQTNAAPRQQIDYSTKLLTAAEVFAEYERLSEGNRDPRPIAGRLGILPEAITALGMLVIHVVEPQRTPTLQLCPSSREGRELLVAPMRKPDGSMSSLRFRCSRTKKRWSLDVKDADGEQEKGSASGLMAHMHVFETGPNQNQVTVTEEGETDLLAGTSMLIKDYGMDPLDWPGLFVGLPGVNSCHEMLVLEVVGKSAWIFFDQDEAGRRAVFDHRWMDPKTGRTDLDREMKPGLLTKFTALGINGLAAFPPRRRTEPTKKVDLRDCFKDWGWCWGDLEQHFLETATRDPLGLRERV